MPMVLDADDERLLKRMFWEIEGKKVDDQLLNKRLGDFPVELRDTIKEGGLESDLFRGLVIEFIKEHY